MKRLMDTEPALKNRLYWLFTSLAFTLISASIGVGGGYMLIGKAGVNWTEKMMDVSSIIFSITFTWLSFNAFLKYLDRLVEYIHLKNNKEIKPCQTF